MIMFSVLKGGSLEAVPLPWSQFEHALLDIDVRVVLGPGDRNGQELTHSLFFYFPEHEALLTREFFEIVDDNYLPLERERESDQRIVSTYPLVN